MALLEMEGFDWEPTGNQVAVQIVNKINPTTGTYMWAGSPGQGSNNASLNPLGVGKGMLFNNGGSLNFTLASVLATGFCGLRYKMGASLHTNGVILQFFDQIGGSVVQVGLAINASGKLFVYRNTSANTLATGTTTILASGIYFIEMKVTIDPTVGAITVKLDGATEISVSGVNTRQTANSSYSLIQINSQGDANSVAIDDFYACDTTGGAPLNDFLSLGGPVCIETIFPNANNAVAFTPNASTNVSQVQETAVDGDGTFNFSASSAQVDTFSHAALSSTPASIYAVAIQAGMRKDDVTVQNGRTKLISGVTTANGASLNLVNGVYTYQQDIYITDPNTAAAWVAANVSATKIGYEHV